MPHFHLVVRACLCGALLCTSAGSSRGQQSPDPIPVLDEIVVSSSPLGTTLAEQGQPVAILTAEDLQLRLEPSLGETLRTVPGVSSTYFGPGASRPVIRGLSDDRVRVLQNGVSTQDVANVSPDHGVPVDPLSLQRVEIIRGPAGLLYGPNTIGGVVNTEDGRIPTERVEPGLANLPLRGQLHGRVGSVDEERAAAGMLEFGVGPLQFHFDAFTRETQDLHIPGFARSSRLRERAPLEPGEKEPRDVLPNSFSRSEGAAGGASYVWDSGYLGLSYSGYNSRYGTVAEPDVTIDLHQRRWDFRGGWREPLPGIKEVRFKLGLADYEHTEFEGLEVGTVFDQQSYDGRFEILHQPLGPLSGLIGYQTQSTDFSALGAEAFLPQVDTMVHSAFVFEEAVFGPWRFQAGLRYDHQSLDSDRSRNFPTSFTREFDALSGSLGVIYSLAETWTLALNGSYAERPPTAVELFAGGPHAATGVFEVGDPDLGLERALAVDLTLRKTAGRFTGSLGGFYYHYSDFIAQEATGLFVGEEDGEEPLPVFAYRATDAHFVGGEAELTWHIIQPAELPLPTGKDGKAVKAEQPRENPHRLDFTVRADYTWTEAEDTGRSLPRIPPFRAGAELAYHFGERFSARVEAQYNAHQNRIAEYELATESFVLLNASLNYRLPIRDAEVDLYVRGTNLLDEEARLHTSFLKDVAPLPGRGVLFGVRAAF